MEFTLQLYGIHFAYDVVRYSYRIIRFTKIYIDKLYQIFFIIYNYCHKINNNT